MSLLGLAIAACGVVACGSAPIPGTQGDPGAPIVVRGTVAGADGAPFAGAGLQLSVLDHANAQLNQPVPTVYQEQFAAGIDGTFAIHLAPSPALTAFAAKNGGWVNFNLLAFSPDSSLIFPTVFPRELAGPAWAGSPPVAHITPDGVTFEGEDEAVPVPIPATN